MVIFGFNNCTNPYLTTNTKTMKTKKIFSKEELEARAADVFNRFPKENKAFATTDGNVFISLNRAELHAGKGKVLTFERPYEPEAPVKEPARISAKDAIAAIAESDLEGLASFADDDRKTVKEAYEKRLEELGINLEKETE